jgi:hypothetical protein
MIITTILVAGCVVLYPLLESGMLALVVIPLCFGLSCLTVSHG